MRNRFFLPLVLLAALAAPAFAQMPDLPEPTEEELQLAQQRAEAWQAYSLRVARALGGSDGARDLARSVANGFYYLVGAAAIALLAYLPTVALHDAGLNALDFPQQGSETGSPVRTSQVDAAEHLSHLVIARSEATDGAGSLRLRNVEDLLEDHLQAAVVGHHAPSCSTPSSRNNHARAMAQSLRTVRSETPRRWAVSRSSPPGCCAGTAVRSSSTSASRTSGSGAS